MYAYPNTSRMYTCKWFLIKQDLYPNCHCKLINKRQISSTYRFNTSSWKRKNFVSPHFWFFWSVIITHSFRKHWINPGKSEVFVQTITEIIINLSLVDVKKERTKVNSRSPMNNDQVRVEEVPKPKRMKPIQMHSAITFQRKKRTRCQLCYFGTTP
jgi:hypothetical protein